jgi:hypothetical protein
MHWKKIVAREFLILLSSVVIYFILIVAHYLHNEMLNDQYYELKKEYEMIVDNSDKQLPIKLLAWYVIINEGKRHSYSENRKDFYYAYEYQYIQGVNTHRREFIENIDEYDYQESIYKELKKLNVTGNVSLEEFQSLIDKDFTSPKILEQLESIEDKVSQIHYNYFNEKNLSSEELSEIIITTLAIFVFIIRYLFYAIRWSIRQLKT